LYKKAVILRKITGFFARGQACNTPHETFGFMSGFWLYSAVYEQYFCVGIFGIPTQPMR